MYTKEQQKAYDAARYRNKKDQLRAGITRRQAEIRTKYRAYKEALCCTDCGNDDPRVIEFDHLGDKLMDISVMVGSGYGWPRILAEMEKCDPVCANCHRIRTWGRNQQSVA